MMVSLHWVIALKVMYVNFLLLIERLSATRQIVQERLHEVYLWIGLI